MRRFLAFLFVSTAPLCVINSRSAVAADISSGGWRLWLDREASWQDDTLYLPSEVDLAKLPANAPTGGWGALNRDAGIPVTLPHTVEEHYWGKFGLRPYDRAVAAIGAHDKEFQNGNYQGVSWWWRTIQAPPMRPGQRLMVHVRGARLRSELYCNGKLCGYSIMTELPFDADITGAVQPGKPAQLALRVTSPGGILDWNDFVPEHFFSWGKYTFPTSHGFCGLDSGITLEARDDVTVTDLAAINTPDLHTVRVLAEVHSRSAAYAVPLNVRITHAGRTIWSGTRPVHLAAGATANVEIEARVPSALPWSLEHPELYRLEAQLGGADAAANGRAVDFGFRFFTATGIATTPDPMLTLNGRRIVVRSAISWGFWGRNGLWPDDAMARREVTAAKALGLNCLQFHRNLSKPLVLDLQDRMGLLRYEEPGAGAAALGKRYDEPRGATFNAKPDYDFPDDIDTSGKGPDGDAVEFWEKYEEARILAMVKRDRSHPALIMYSIQNEGAGNDLRNPRIYRIYREMHALDPSRIIILHSGTTPKRGQVLMLPYSDKIAYSSKSDLWGGWRDQHSVGGPGNYIDSLYTGPADYSQRTPENGAGAISMWGEMLGVGTPDDFATLVASYDRDHPGGYDFDDDKRVLAATDAFLDTWHFRDVFPTTSDYFRGIGAKGYFFWQKIMEQARADNANDYLVISGWESTTIDNHSGIVDNHRFFKADPAILRRACAPEMLVVRPRRLVLAKGQKNLVDVFLVNETGRKGAQTLTLTTKRPDGSTIATVARTVTVTGGDTYGQLLLAGTEFTADAAGLLSVEATLAPAPGTNPATTLTRAEQVNVIETLPIPVNSPRVAVLEPGNDVSATLSDTLHLVATKYDPMAVEPGAAPNVIVLASKGGDPDFDALAAAAGTQPAPKGAGKTFDAALSRAHDDGARLVLWPNGERSARWMVGALAQRKVVTLDDWVGHTGASWFGSWYFVRPHWLFSGLPAGAMDWRYGNDWKPRGEKGDDFGTGGAVMSAPGMEVACGYGNNDRKTLLGTAACVIPYGKGQIVWFCQPQLLTALTHEQQATNRAIARRLLANAILGPPAP